MSEIGLNASIYEYLRIYADRIDYALIKIRSSNIQESEKARKDLVELLQEIGVDESLKPEILLLNVILREQWTSQPSTTKETFQRLAYAMERKTENGDDYKNLEEIAAVIDKECLNVSSRMQR
jgi:hypothetical protein